MMGYPRDHVFKIGKPWKCHHCDHKTTTQVIKAIRDHLDTIHGYCTCKMCWLAYQKYTRPVGQGNRKYAT